LVTTPSLARESEAAESFCLTTRRAAEFRLDARENWC
jgi:hypothetical protein